MGVYGRAALDRSAKSNKLGLCFEFNGLNDVKSHFQRVRLDSQTKVHQGLGKKHYSFDGLSNNVWSQEESLHEQAILVEGQAQVAANTRSRQPVKSRIDCRLTAGYVSAAYSQAATRIFDQRAGDQIGADTCRFARLDEFPIAVVNDDQTMRIDFLDRSRQFANFAV